MTATPIRVLLLEDNQGDARLVQAALADHAPGEFAVTWVERLADALARIQTERFDAVLCDLGLPDSSGLATAQAIAAQSSALPLVVLTGSHDEDLGRAAIQHGAQDYLVKGEADGALIARTLRYAIERKRLEIGLRVTNEALERRVAERTAELEAAVKKLGTSEARFRELTELSSDWYWEQNANFRFTWFSDGAMAHTGTNVAEYLGKSRQDLPIDQVSEERWAEHRRQMEARLPFRDFQYRWTSRSGERYDLSISGRPMFDEHGQFRGYHGVGSDITKRKQAELALARQKDLYDALSRSNQAIVRGTSRDELFLAVCRIAVEHGRFSFAWIGLIDHDERQVKLVAQYGEDAGYLSQLHMSVDQPGVPGRSVTGQALLAGRHGVSNDFLNDPLTAPWHDAARRAGVRAFAVFPIRQGGVVIGAISVYAGESGFFTDDLLTTLDEMALDVSFALDNFAREAERQQAIEALHESEEKYRGIYDSLQDVYVEATLDGTILEISPQVERLSKGQYKREDLLGASLYTFYDDPRCREAILLEMKQHGRAVDMESVFRNRDGSLIPCSISATIVRGANGNLRSVGTVRDITARKLAEQELRAAEERFRVLVEQSYIGIFIIQQGKFSYVNPRFVEIMGYDSDAELIGLDPLSITVESDLAGAQDTMRRLMEGTEGRISHSLAARRRDGSTVDLGLQSVRAAYHGQPAILGMMQDISEKKRAEERIQRYVAQLKIAFMQTVGVATALSEMRDPYTAGHERRVAEIAAAMAAEMGLDADRIEGIRVAGYLHDIGKITIPSEILSKPGKLSPLEFQLIKGHSQASYDVLKGVEFPWPVADVALQHHERIDGSGYPQGLKGDSILLEARIMAVADVIEAMSSHRPYRAGLGIEKALAEIERGRGTAYDPVVADACLKLFRETGYAIPA